MSLTLDLLLRVFITFVLRRVLRFDGVIFGNFETLMGGDAVVANQLGTVDAVARRRQLIVGALRHLLR